MCVCVRERERERVGGMYCSGVGTVKMSGQ
jgi:hypothetical protein